MMVIALTLRPWVMEMSKMQVKPRILADDLLVVANGAAHAVLAEQAIDKTHRMLGEMGAKVAANKSYNFSSSPDMRRWMREHRWRHLDSRILVVNDTRDRGAHLVAAGRLTAATLTGRINEATTV